MKEYIIEDDIVGEAQFRRIAFGKVTGELIRCQDRYFCDTFQRKNWCTKYDHAVTQDGFCAWAEPKEPEE